MTPLHLVCTSAAMATVALLTAASAAAQQAPSPFGARSAPRPPDSLFAWDKGHGHHRGFAGFIIVEREVPVIVEREVVVEKVAAPPAPPPAPAKPRNAYVIGASYASLPGGCMKLIEGGASYYYCGGGEWYRLVGKAYRAVKRGL